MKIHIIVDGRVTGRGKDDYSYFYRCEEVDKGYTVPRGFEYIPSYYPHTLHYYFVNEVDTDGKPTEDYLSALTEYLNDNYKKAMPKSEKIFGKFDDDVFSAIDDFVKENLRSSSFSM